jgi:hypothetical protein
MMLDCKAPTGGRWKREASNPHALQAIHVYADAQSVAPLWDLYGEFSEGSLLLKEKFDRTKPEAPLLFTGMIKREPGYFPDGGDWEYFTLNGELTEVTSRGKLQTCAACHRDFADWGFVSKQYTSVPFELREYFDLSAGRTTRIAPGSSDVLYLPASLAETHGPKLSRGEAIVAWGKDPKRDQAENVPEDLRKYGGPTLRYEIDKQKNTLGYWTHEADWALWDIDIHRPGDYQVSVLQGCGTGSEGAEVAISLDGRELTFVVEETGGFQTFKWRDVGILNGLQSGPQTLTVKARSKPGPAVMDLRQIILQPRTDADDK